VNIWDLSLSDWEKIYQNFDGICPKQNIGDITVVCHTSNQAHLLKSWIADAKTITDKVIIFDDCSTDDTRKISLDNGCRVFDIPEGWIYTHGFGALIVKQVQACETEYHFQLDMGEKLWLPPGCPKIEGEYAWNLRINWGKNERERLQKMYYRLINTGVDVDFSACIHGIPKNPDGAPGGLTHSQVAIFHPDSELQGNPEVFWDRKTRLYLRLIRKGYREKTLANAVWEEEYSDNEAGFDEKITKVENKIGVLEETSEDIREVFS